MSKTKLSILALLAFGTASSYAAPSGAPGSVPWPTEPAPSVTSTSSTTAPTAQPAQPVQPNTVLPASTSTARLTPATKSGPALSTDTTGAGSTAEPALPPAAGQTTAPDNLGAYASPDSRPFTLGEVEYKQGELARARMDADIAKARADTRGADNSSVTPGGQISDETSGPHGKKEIETDPTRDFAPYSYYKFGKSACADIVFHGALFTRCAGDNQTLNGWKLSALSPEHAVFQKGRESRSVSIGVATPSQGLALPVPPLPVAH